MNVDTDSEKHSTDKRTSEVWRTVIGTETRLGERTFISRVRARVKTQDSMVLPASLGTYSHFQWVLHSSCVSWGAGGVLAHSQIERDKTDAWNNGEGMV